MELIWQVTRDTAQVIQRTINNTEDRQLRQIDLDAATFGIQVFPKEALVLARL